MNSFKQLEKIYIYIIKNCMDAFDKIGHFCEQKLLGRPEILNCISSLFIIIIPYLGLKYSTINNFWIKNILQLLILDGFTAFGYHWTGYYIFKHLDEIPMVISIWLGILMLVKEIAQYHTKFQHVSVLVNIYFTCMLAINTVPNFNEIFAPAYALPSISLIPLVLYYFYIASHISNVKKNIYTGDNLANTQTSHKLFFTGVVISSFSAIAWVLSEAYCRYIFLLGHSLWHVTMPLGMYYIMISIEYFQQSLHNKNTSISIFYKHNILPIIV